MSAEPSDALTRSAVVSVYQEFLERTPGPAEISAQMAACPTLAVLLRIVHASDEYAVRQRAGGRPAPAEVGRVNVWHPDLAAWTHPPGTLSVDGVAIVGHEGWMFIRGGSNAMVEQYRGAETPPAGWLEAWRLRLEERTREAAHMRIRLAGLVVPDKLLIHEEHFPESVEMLGPRPVQRLLDVAGPELVYPLEALRAARAAGPVALRTDSHLTLHGNAVLAQSVLDVVQTSAPPLSLPAGTELLLSGDLGSRLDPAVQEVAPFALSYGAAEVVDDNRDEIAALGGHVGSLRVLRNATAPDHRVAVVFGDSYSFAAPHYQGLTWYLAQAFTEVHFVWVPFGWDPAYVRDTGAEVVIMQTAERFVARAPLPRVDVRALARDAIATGSPPGLDDFSQAL